MAGLLGSMEVANSGLRAAQVAIDTTGSNLANVGNAAYARRRANLEAARSGNAFPGGVDVTDVQGVRDRLLEAQISRETSLTGQLEARQRVLKLAEGYLGQTVDAQTQATAGATVSSLAADGSLSSALSLFFNSARSLATNPASLPGRESFLANASQLADRLRQVDGRLSQLAVDLDQDITGTASRANDLLSAVATLGRQISSVGLSQGLSATVAMEDQLQQRIGELSTLVPLEYGFDADNQFQLSIAGVSVVEDGKRVGSLRVSGAAGALQVDVVADSGAAARVTGGQVGGLVGVRDGALAEARARNDTLASVLIASVNNVHATGIGLGGASGRDLFSGTGAGDIRVDPVIRDDPRLLQLSASGGSADGSVATAIGRLDDRPQASLSGMTFSGFYGQTVSGLGQHLVSVNNQIADQSAIAGLLSQQRTAISGVSLDEEMSQLLVYQRAYQASARLVSVVDSLMETVVNLGR